MSTENTTHLLDQEGNEKMTAYVHTKQGLMEAYMRYNNIELSDIKRIRTEVLPFISQVSEMLSNGVKMHLEEVYKPYISLWDKWMHHSVSDINRTKNLLMSTVDRYRSDYEMYRPLHGHVLTQETVTDEIRATDFYRHYIMSPYWDYNIPVTVQEFMQQLINTSISELNILHDMPMYHEGLVDAFSYSSKDLTAVLDLFDTKKDELTFPDITNDIKSIRQKRAYLIVIESYLTFRASNLPIEHWYKVIELERSNNELTSKFEPKS